MNYLNYFVLKFRVIDDGFVADLNLTIDKNYENFIND